jgi:hypothetical protein
MSSSIATPLSSRVQTEDGKEKDTDPILKLRTNTPDVQIKASRSYYFSISLPSLTDGTLTHVTFVIDFHQKYFEVQYW